MRATVASYVFLCWALARVGRVVGVAYHVVMTSSELSRSSYVALCRILIEMKRRVHCARVVFD